MQCNRCEMAATEPTNPMWSWIGGREAGAEVDSPDAGVQIIYPLVHETPNEDGSYVFLGGGDTYSTESLLDSTESEKSKAPAVVPAIHFC